MSATTPGRHLAAFLLAAFTSLVAVLGGMALGVWLLDGVAMAVLVPGGILFVGVALIAVWFGFNAGRRAAAALSRGTPSSTAGDDRSA